MKFWCGSKVWRQNYDSRLSDIHIPASDSRAWLLTWFTQTLQECGYYTNTSACWEAQSLGHRLYKVHPNDTLVWDSAPSSSREDRPRQALLPGSLCPYTWHHGLISAPCQPIPAGLWQKQAHSPVNPAASEHTLALVVPSSRPKVNSAGVLISLASISKAGVQQVSKPLKQKGYVCHSHAGGLQCQWLAIVVKLNSPTRPSF